MTRAVQIDLFAEDTAERNTLSEQQRQDIRAKLEATIARLEATATFPWRDPLDAAHEENRFERGSLQLGEEGVSLWERFDREMERLHATRFPSDSGSDE